MDYDVIFTDLLDYKLQDGCWIDSDGDKFMMHDNTYTHPYLFDKIIPLLRHYGLQWRALSIGDEVLFSLCGYADHQVIEASHKNIYDAFVECLIKFCQEK